MTILKNDFQTITSTDKGSYTKFDVKANDGVVLIVTDGIQYYLVNAERDNGNSIEFARGWVRDGETIDTAVARLASVKLGVTYIRGIHELGNPVKLDNSWIDQDVHFVLVDVENMGNDFSDDVWSINMDKLVELLAVTTDSYSLMAYTKLLVSKN